MLRWWGAHALHGQDSHRGHRLTGNDGILAIGTSLVSVTRTLLDDEAIKQHNTTHVEEGDLYDRALDSEKHSAT